MVEVERRKCLPNKRYNMDTGTGVGARHMRKDLQSENQGLCLCRGQGDRVSESGGALLDLMWLAGDWELREFLTHMETQECHPIPGTPSGDSRKQ